EESYFFLQWSFDRLLVGIASQGVISGKVRRIVPPGPGQTDPTYVPISGARVQLSDGGLSQIAVSQADGSFAIWDRRLGGGTRKVTAFYGNESVEATAFEVNAAEPDPVYFPNVQIYRYYKNLAKVNFAFPALAPPPPTPKVDIRLYTLDEDDLRVPATGVLQSGTPLVIAFKTPLTVTGSTVGGAPQNVTTPDVPDNPQDPLKLDARVVGTYTVGPPGVYTIVATALQPLGGPPVTTTRSFLAVAAGSGNGSPVPGAPVVVQTSPLEGAEGISTTAFPQVTFSEPVTQVPGNVTLTDSSGQAPGLRLIGIRTDGSVANPVGAADVITALTLQPTTGLKFGETYTLTLGNGIVDRDEPPLHLAPFTLHFATFGPQALGATGAFSSTRPAIIGQRAYVAKTSSIHSSLNIIDISDPAHPVEVGTPAWIVGHAADVAGIELSPVTQGPLVALAAGVGTYPLPSNLWIYDVSNPDAPERVAAVSASTSASQDGTLLRIAMKGGSVYASTYPKGIQVIDVQEAVSAYENRDTVTFGRRITTEGQGFATEAVVNTIPLKTAQGGIATMYDLEAGDFATVPPDPDDPDAPVPTETLVVAAGRVPFVVVNPLQSGPSAVLYPPLDSGGQGLSASPLQSADGRFRLELGFRLAIGTLPQTDAEGNSRSLPVALVVGNGTATNGGTAASVPLLAVVDLTDPRHPKPLGFLQLPETAGDVALKDSIALIASGGKIRLVSLADPAHPTDAGMIEGTFGDRLAITDSGIIVTASLNGNLGGIRTSSLGAFPLLEVTPESLLADDEDLSTTDLRIGYKI
ncbi:MAG TPA: Ig-like domain-containing protein, partial [Thermoanaerobaculia bacterium]